MTNTKVTAKVNYVIEHHGRDGLFAARVPALRLTGYGKTKEDAIQSCKRLYRTFARAYRSRNMFPSVLDRSGIKWSYAS